MEPSDSLMVTLIEEKLDRHLTSLTVRCAQSYWDSTSKNSTPDAKPIEAFDLGL